MENKIVFGKLLLNLDAKQKFASHFLTEKSDELSSVLTFLNSVYYF